MAADGVMQGRCVLVTGATAGLGREVARRLAEAGAKVLIHGRDAGKVEAVRSEIGAAEGFVADLASLAEVRRLGEEVAARHDRLHVLLNNAGIGLFAGQPRTLSRDGLELHFAVNYLAPFLLTGLLLDRLKAAAPSRIVNVASVGQAPIDFGDVTIEQGYAGPRAYSQSKLAQIMFTFTLAERLKGTGVTVTALHPATFMATNMVSGQGLAPRSTIDDGAGPTFRLAAAPEAEGITGAYFNQWEAARAHDQAYDAQARRRLWALSLELAGLEDSAFG